MRPLRRRGRGRGRSRGRAFILPAATLIAALIAAPTAAREPVTVERLAGADRYETAARVVRDAWQDRDVSRVYIARGDLFPDALAVSCTAGAYNGGEPLLLTRPDGLPEPTRQELRRLGTNYAYIVGDREAVSQQVEQDLADMGIIVEGRTAGSDRYWTARSVAGRAPDDCLRTVLLATGTDFADALAAGPMASILSYPVLLTTPHSLHPAVQDFFAFEDDSIDEVVILGGPNAISKEVERQVRSYRRSSDGEGFDVVRIDGADRTETAALLASELLERRNIDVTHVNLARGDAFPDAAAGAPHAGLELAPILLTRNPDDLGEATAAWLRDHADTIESIHVFGSPEAVSDDVLEQARRAAS